MDLPLAREIIAEHRRGGSSLPGPRGRLSKRDWLLLASALALDPETMDHALKMGASPDAEGNQANALTLTAYSDSFQENGASVEAQLCMRMLIEAGAKLDGIQTLLWMPCTLLAALAHYGREDLARIMLDAGADLNAAPGEHPMDAGEACIIGYRPGLLGLLIERGLDIRRAQRPSVPPLSFVAVLCNRRECLEALLAAGADPHEACSTGVTLLELALKSSDPGIHAWADRIAEADELRDGLRLATPETIRARTISL